MKIYRLNFILILFLSTLIFSSCLEFLGSGGRKSSNVAASNGLTGLSTSCLDGQLLYLETCYTDPNCDTANNEFVDLDEVTGQLVCVNNNPDPDPDPDPDPTPITLSTPLFKPGKGIADLAVIQGSVVNTNASFALSVPAGVSKYEIKVIASSGTEFLCQMQTSANGISCGTNVGSPVGIKWRGLSQTGSESSSWSPQYSIVAPPPSTLTTPALVSGKTVDDVVTYVGMIQRLVINAGANLTQPSGVVKYEYKFLDSNNPATVRTCTDTVANIILNGIPWGASNSCGILLLDYLPVTVQWRGCNSVGTTCSNWSTPVVFISAE